MSNLTDFLNKKYYLAESINFDHYMKSLGVGLVTRKIANAVSPVLDLSIDGDHYIINQKSSFKNVVLKFKPGEEFEQETPDGRKVKSIITIDGTTFHEVQKSNDGKETVIDRTFGDNEVKMVMTHEDVKATRIYKLQE